MVRVERRMRRGTAGCCNSPAADRRRAPPAAGAARSRRSRRSSPAPRPGAAAPRRRWRTSGRCSGCAGPATRRRRRGRRSRCSTALLVKRAGTTLLQAGRRGPRHHPRRPGHPVAILIEPPRRRRDQGQRDVPPPARSPLRPRLLPRHPHAARQGAPGRRLPVLRDRQGPGRPRARLRAGLHRRCATSSASRSRRSRRPSARTPARSWPTSRTTPTCSRCGSQRGRRRTLVSRSPAQRQLTCRSLDVSGSGSIAKPDRTNSSIAYGQSSKAMRCLDITGQLFV